MTSASLKTLLKQTKKQVQPGDGAGKVTLALATMTSLSADAAKGVLDLPFSSRQIGLGDKAGLKRFKKSLASHLPEASAAIAKIPEHSELTPRDIAGLATRLMRTAVKAEPLRSAPAIHVKPQSEEARSRFADLLGKAFAEKASDRMVQAVGFRLQLGVREAVSAVLQSMVFEFETPGMAIAGGGARESGSRESMAGSRSLQVQAVCDAFYRLAGPIRAEIERLAGPPSAGFRESVADLGSAVDVCWLNGTMRTLTTLRSIADIVADRAILRVGIPKALERELNRSVKAINAAAFRSANHLTGAGVRVAVIDGEVFANHPALAGRVIQKKNYTKEAWGNPDAHGTAVAGIIASADATFTGIAPGATIFSYKVFATNSLLQGSDFDAAVAIQQALEDGVQVANCSWGVGLATDGTSRVAKACDQAWDLGLVIVKSAGNRGPGAGTLTSPADARGVIVVGATNRKGNTLESYSSRGPIPAKAGPDMMGPGASPTDSLSSLLAAGGTGEVGHGTSYAAPHVSGAAALLLEQAQNRSPDQVRQQLIAGSLPIKKNFAAGCGAGLMKL